MLASFCSAIGFATIFALGFATQILSIAQVCKFQIENNMFHIRKILAISILNRYCLAARISNGLLYGSQV